MKKLKHIEITMAGGSKFYLVMDESNGYSESEIDYVMAGKSGIAVAVNTSASVDSEVVYINPNRIEYFKKVF